MNYTPKKIKIKKVDNESWNFYIGVTLTGIIIGIKNGTYTILIEERSWSGYKTLKECKQAIENWQIEQIKHFCDEVK